MRLFYYCLAAELAIYTSADTVLRTFESCYSKIPVPDIKKMASCSAKFKFAIDRGGTFTDIYAICPDGKERVTKLLSVDPSNYKDAPREGIRRIIEQVNTFVDKLHFSYLFVNQSKICFCGF